MSNSSLVTYTNKTSKHNNRTHAIDTITIHHMSGKMTAKSCCDYFCNTSAQVSANYCIGYDGSIGLNVDEKYRAWTSSNSANDHRAITIEVSNDGGSPDWHVSEKSMTALINLVADICKRNGIKKLVWSNSSSDRINHKNGCNMTVHKDFASTDCPGKYLYSKLGEVATKVNAKLGATTTTTTTTSTTTTSTSKTTTSSFFPARGYYKKGDVSPNVGKIATFMRKTFPSYTPAAALGNTYGDNLIKAVKQFQKNTKLEADGYFGPATLKKLKDFGFKE